MNISIVEGVPLQTVYGKPITLVCEIVEGPGGQPVLRSRYPCDLKIRELAKGETRLELVRRDTFRPLR